MLKITVEPLIHMVPNYVILNLKEGETVSQVITIKAGTDKPLELIPGEFSLEGKVAYKMEEFEKGREWDIEFTTLSGQAEDFHGFLKLKTNYPERPDIAVIISGRNKEPIDPRSGARPRSAGTPPLPQRDGR